MIIGISGKIGTGKSSIARRAAEMIVERGGKAELLPFGLILKQECALRYKFPLGCCMTQEGKSQVIFHPEFPAGCMTVRGILQWYGTDICRKADPDYWVKHMGILVDGIKSGTVIVIDDVRFPNEATFVQDRGGFLVRVHPYCGWEPGPDAVHESETALDNWGKWDAQFWPYQGEAALSAVAEQILDKFYQSEGLS